MLLNPGDEVIVPEPCYVAYEPCIAFAGGVPVRVPTRGEDGFAVDAAVVEAAVTPRTKAVLLGSPANPTGAVQPRASLEALVRLAERRDLYLVSDEIYDRLTYDTAHTCLGTLAPRPHGAARRVLQGARDDGLAGRLICAPRAVAELCVRVHQYTMLCAPHVSQMAAIEALSGPTTTSPRWSPTTTDGGACSSRACVRSGSSAPSPVGAFYAFPSIRSSGMDSATFAEELLHAEGVAVVPGNVFGPSGRDTCAAPTPPRCPCWRRRSRGWTAS